MSKKQAHFDPKLAATKPGIRVAVIQSNYIPWVGYFAIMGSVDLFIVYECVQYTKNDWRNRNQIDSPNGQRTWLSIPVRQYKLKQTFMETTVLNSQWPSKHFKTLQHCFAQKHGWRRWSHELELLYKEAEKLKYLYEVNRLFLTWARNLLKLRAEMIFLDSYPEYPDPNDRLISILNEFGASHYLSGPAAQDYIDPEKFREARIDLEYVNYDQLIRSIFSTTGEINSTSVLQLILEGQHEFKNH